MECYGHVDSCRLLPNLPLAFLCSFPRLPGAFLVKIGQVSALRERPARWSECLSKTWTFCGSDHWHGWCWCNKVEVLMTFDSWRVSIRLRSSKSEPWVTRCTKTWAIEQYANSYNAYSFANLQWSSYMSCVLEDSARPLYMYTQLGNNLML